MLGVQVDLLQIIPLIALSTVLHFIKNSSPDNLYSLVFLYNGRGWSSVGILLIVEEEAILVIGGGALEKQQHSQTDL